MASSTTLFEHEVSSADLDEYDITALERLNRAAGTEILGLIPEHGRLRLKAREYVGVIRLKRQTVQVLPKMYRASDALPEKERARQSTSNLLHLLSWARQLPIREQEIAPLLKRDLDWFEILTRLFVTHLFRGVAIWCLLYLSDGRRSFAGS